MHMMRDKFGYENGKLFLLHDGNVTSVNDGYSREDVFRRNGVRNIKMFDKH